METRHLTHKTKLRVHPKDEVYFRCASGVHRHAYNWALTEWKQRKVAGEKCNIREIRKHYNYIKREQFPWSLEVTKWASQKGIEDVGVAFQNFFKNPGHFGYPKFKKKSGKKSFYIGSDNLCIKGKRIRVAGHGWVTMHEPVRFPGKCKSVTIKQESSGDWYAAVLVEIDDSYEYRHKCESQAVVGIDIGLSTYVTLSTGEKISLPKPYRQMERKLRKKQQVVSRRDMGSRNRAKALLAAGKVSTYIKNVRQHHIHNLTARLVRDFRFIGVEGINFDSMKQSLNFGKSVSDASFGEFRRQLDYKTRLAGGHLVVADKWFASSKLCSVCGHKNEELTLNHRSWLCVQCGVIHDRDNNASVNLSYVAAEYADTLNACGEVVRPMSILSSAASVNQELLHESVA